MARAWSLGRLVPGVALVALVTWASFALAAMALLPSVGPTALAVAIGLVVGNAWPVGPRFGPGTAFVGKHVLTVAVVLLGLAVTWGDVVLLGPLVLGVVVVALAMALALAWVLGRAAGVAAPLSALVGVGTAVCGVSAIAAARGAVGARDEQVTYAVAAVTFLGSIGLVVYPLIQLGLHPVTAEAYGVWAGATLHSVPQAVGAGFAGGGDAAGVWATVTKLARVALLGPVVLLLAVAFGARGTDAGRAPVRRVPVEVWGFLLLFGLGSLLALPERLLETVAAVDRVLLVAALGALGLMTRFGDLRRAGVAPLVVAMTTWLLVGTLVVAGLHLVG